MNRIEELFAERRESGQKTLVGYLTAGDPEMDVSEANIRAVLENGVDLLELGVPFSDPTADGPTIQVAAQRALAAGTDIDAVLDLVRRLRVDFDTPIVLFGYVNPLFRYGYAEICRDAAQTGADGLLVVDLPFEMTGELQPHADANDLVLVPLVAPTTSPERAAKMLKDARGFVYYVMVKGVTGARDAIADDVTERAAVLRGVTDLPIAAGFGVSSGAMAHDVGQLVDAVVVGSALVKAGERGPDALAALVRELKDGVSGAA